MTAREWMETATVLARSGEPGVQIAAMRLLQPALGTDKIQRKPEDALAVLRAISRKILSREATPEFRAEWDRLAALAMAELPRGQG